MPLNNTTKNFFETLRKKSKTQIMRPLREMLIEEYRQSSKEFFSELCEMSIPEGITVSILDIPSIDGNIIHTRIYHSEAYSINSRGKNPAVIFFPGGGFILQLPDYYDNPCAKMAKESGCTVIAVYCRVAPEFTHQYGMADAILATKYCFTHAQQLNLDQERFAVAGNSSGGNFAALVTNALRGSDVKISYQLLLSPRVDVSLTCGGTQDYMPYQEQDIMLSREAQEYFTTLYIPRNLDPKDKSISPYYDDLTELPPTTIIVSEYDGLRGDSEIYAKKLIASGVIVEKIICEGQVHNSLLCRKVLEEGPDQAILAGKCLKVHLKEL